VADIPEVEKCLSFYFEVGQIVKNTSKITLKLGVRLHITSFKPISLLNNENILSAYPNCGFVLEIDISFVNSNFRSLPDFMSEYSRTTFTSSSLFC
jgi:hypothetical protein